MKENTLFICLLVFGIIAVFGLSLTTPAVFCTTEAKMCPDGSYVGRNPSLQCEFDPCPGGDVIDYASLVNSMRANGYDVKLQGNISQPFVPFEGQTFRLYDDDFHAFKFESIANADSFASTISADGNTINGQTLDWVAAPHFYKKNKLIVVYIGTRDDVQNALISVMGEQFAGANILSKIYIGHSPEECATIRFACAEGTEYFSDDMGCGCKPRQENVFCTPDQRNAEVCIEIYKPVCGWYDPAKIQCIRYPCAETFSNSCFACGNENVLYYTEGQCPP